MGRVTYIALIGILLAGCHPVQKTFDDFEAYCLGKGGRITTTMEKRFFGWNASISCQHPDGVGMDWY